MAILEVKILSFDETATLVIGKDYLEFNILGLVSTIERGRTFKNVTTFVKRIKVDIQKLDKFIKKWDEDRSQNSITSDHGIIKEELSGVALDLVVGSAGSKALRVSIAIPNFFLAENLLLFSLFEIKNYLPLFPK